MEEERGGSRENIVYIDSRIPVFQISQSLGLCPAELNNVAIGRIEFICRLLHVIFFHPQ